MFIYIYISEPTASYIASKLHYIYLWLQNTVSPYSLIHYTRNFFIYQLPKITPQAYSHKDYRNDFIFFSCNFRVMCLEPYSLKALQTLHQHYACEFVAIDRAWSVWIKALQKVLIVFWIATNSFLLPSIRTSIESRQLRPATGLALRPEPATGLGRVFTKPRAAWVGG